MKTLLFSLLSVLFCYSAISQCTQPVISPSSNVILCSGSSTTLLVSKPVSGWDYSTPFAGTGRSGAVAFSISSKGYIGTGSGGGDLKDFWEYDPATGAWTQKADFGGSARSGAVGFSIGNKGYIGTGSGTKDFWEYNPATNTWARKADFGGTARSSAVGFNIGSKGYIGTGDDGNYPYYKDDFWEYNPATDAWTQKAGIYSATNATGFSIGNKGYIGLGLIFPHSGRLALDYWFEYDPSTDTWIQKSSFPGGGRYAAAGFGIGSKGYIAGGNTITSDYPTDSWQYNPASDSWTKTSDPVYGPGYGAVAFTIGNTGYVGCGGGGTNFEKYTQAPSYRWSPGGDTTSSITVIKAGKYTVTTTGISGCAATSEPVYVKVHPAANNKLYVDASVAESGNGSSWKTAVKDLNDALRFANGCNSIDSILIAKGTYKPTQGTERDTTFAITRGGIKLYGGYPSGGGRRDVKMNATVLSGDIGAKGDSTDNSSHVMIIVGLPQGADSVVVDGLKIKDGSSYQSIFDFHGYYVGAYGSGIYMTSNKNKGICFTNCLITNNLSYVFGGVYNEESYSLFKNCAFVSNKSKSTEGLGGAVSVLGLTGRATALFYNCAFYDNSASNEGGAIYGSYDNNINIYNCTFVKNTSGGSVISGSNSYDTIANSIFWSNKSSTLLNASDHSIVRNCLIQGGYNGGEKILTKNPRFVNINNLLGPDHILGTADDGLQLQSNSPAINAGDNSFATGNPTDITGSPRIVNGTVDLGAYEYNCDVNNTITALENKAIPGLPSEADFSINLYPNPAVKTATLSVSDAVKSISIRLTDLSGKLIWKKEKITDKNIQIPVSDLPAGTYLVTVQSETLNKTLKLIKQQ